MIRHVAPSELRPGMAIAPAAGWSSSPDRIVQEVKLLHAYIDSEDGNLSAADTCEALYRLLGDLGLEVA